MLKVSKELRMKNFVSNLLERSRGGSGSLLIVLGHLTMDTFSVAIQHPNQYIAW